MGGTAGLAQMMGESFERQGVDVVVRQAKDVDSLEGFNTVILGGALYMMRWHRDARRFARRHTTALRFCNVWLFSSGPLDDSATKKEIPPVRQVRKVMARLGARGHATFGGRLEANPQGGGRMARSMAKKTSGDWRDPHQVDAWVTGIADAIQAHHDAPST
jgi:menaquinone-dependent protoporphyrinogen oxidase